MKRRPAKVRRGAGFFTKLKDIARGTSQVLRAVVKGETGQLLSKRPLVVKQLLAAHGAKTVRSVLISKNPIQSFIQKALNVTTDIQAAMSKFGYDKLFHLFMNVTLDDGTVVGLEKNERVNVRQGGFAPNPADKLQVNVTPMTLNELYARAERKVGGERLYRYNASTTNCQRYIADLMDVLAPGNAQVPKYVLQKTGALLSNRMQSFSNKLTDFAALGNYAFKGGRRARRYTPRMHGGKFRFKDLFSKKNALLLAGNLLLPGVPLPYPGQRKALKAMHLI